MLIVQRSRVKADGGCKRGSGFGARDLGLAHPAKTAFILSEARAGRRATSRRIPSTESAPSVATPLRRFRGILQPFGSRDDDWRIEERSPSSRDPSPRFILPVYPHRPGGAASRTLRVFETPPLDCS